MIEVTDADFAEKVLKANLPVLVDFWAPWCGPCKQLAPHLKALAEKYEGQLLVAKVNVDENSESPAEYGVKGIPALLMFKNGEVVGTSVGFAGAEKLGAFVSQHVAASAVGG